MATATRYAVKNGSDFYKRSFDAFNGNWTRDESKATTWATPAGAQKAATLRQQYARDIKRTAEAERICVVRIEREVF